MCYGIKTLEIGMSLFHMSFKIFSTPVFVSGDSVALPYSQMDILGKTVFALVCHFSMT